MRTIGELLEAIDLVEEPSEKAALLRKNLNNTVIDFLNFAFGEHKWVYMKRTPPKADLTEPPYGYSETNLSFELRRMYIFQEGSVVKESRQDELYIQIMESLPKTEAEVLEAILTGKSDIGIEGFNREFVSQVFPELFEKKTA